GAMGGDQIALAAFGEAVFGALPSIQRGRDQASRRADRQGIVIAGQAAGQRDESPGALALGKRLGAPARFGATALGHNPDLENLGGDIFKFVLAMGDAGAGTHYLHIARYGTALVAKVVL